MKKIVNGFENYSVDTLGIVRNEVTGIIRKTYIDNHGRIMIDLYKNNIRKKFLLHRLVALHFLPNEFNKPQINHINGICADNRLENLEWVTDSENKYHAHKTGLMVSKKIPVSQYSLNGDFIKSHLSILHAHKETKVDRKSIQKNLEGKYSHAGGYIWKLNKLK